jgi:hypothetical protein
MSVTVTREALEGLGEHSFASFAVNSVTDKDRTVSRLAPAGVPISAVC